MLSCQTNGWHLLFHAGDPRTKAHLDHSEKHPMNIEGIVILPDHLHCLWRLPEKDDDFSIRWSKIKRYFSLSAAGAEQSQVSEARRRKKDVKDITHAINGAVFEVNRVQGSYWTCAKGMMFNTWPPPPAKY